MDDRLRALVRSVDDTEVVSADRLALLIRLSRSFTFCGSTREQIVRAVEAQDLEQFDLEELYQ